jgi:hypothetical protein
MQNLQEGNLILTREIAIKPFLMIPICKNWIWIEQKLKFFARKDQIIVKSKYFDTSIRVIFEEFQKNYRLLQMEVA